jgi:uncharacterized lipoprotein YajG
MNKRAVIFVMVAVMLFTFCVAPPANAIVPALAWAIWGIAAGVTGIAVVADETSDHEQAKADSQGQEERGGTKNLASELQQSPG